MNSPLYIYASGDHYHQVDEVPPDLKELTQQVTGKSFRRIGRFIQLAMIGAARCTNLSVPPDTAVYLASGRGDLETTLDIMKDLFANSQAPKPLAFVNTVSNAACFYVAQLLKLHSRSNYVCNRHFAFESALQLAITDLRMGNIASALIGSVDICTQPVSEHRQRLHLTSPVNLGEGSHWLWIGTLHSEQKKLGTLLEVRHFDDRDGLLAWRHTHAFDTLALSRGQFVDDAQWDALSSVISHNTIFDYRDRAYYDSQSGAAIGEFLRSDCPAGTLLHINADSDGRYSVMVVSR